MKARKLFRHLTLAVLLSFASLSAQSEPQILGTYLNDGSPQRSMIQSIGVRFDRNVAGLLSPGDLKVMNIGTGAFFDTSGLEIRFDPRNNSASWLLERDSNALLDDGNYLAWVDVERLLSEPERAACAVSAMPLDDFTFAFHQFCGDADGDRDVDFRDSCMLRETWQQRFGDSRYLSYFDFDVSDVVGENDRSLVANTYFSILEPAPAIHLFLRNDTGEDFTDKATSLYHFGFASTAVADDAIWRVSLDGGTASALTANAGSGVIGEDFIDTLAGGSLALGNHSLRIEAVRTDGTILAADTVDFDYLGEVACPPFFITTPTPGVSLGTVTAPRPISLASWTVEPYPGFQTTSNWVIAPDGLSVRQTRNAAPSLFLSPDSLLNLRITGRFLVDTAGDDDYMGFVFGYQNSKQFYLFSWKQATQNLFGGNALRGMSIRRLDAGDGEIDEADFWWSHQDRDRMTVIVPPNDIPWEDFQEYDITLEFTPGHFAVEVMKEGVLLDRLEADDENFTGGRFGFYNHSQDNVVYSGFSTESLNNLYYYDSEAEDPDGSQVTYSFANSAGDIPPPAGATINAGNGTILWQPVDAGTFPFTIVATDSDGLTDTQSFDVTVTPVDLPPTVVIEKTAAVVAVGQEVGIRAIASDDEQVLRARLFIDDVEIDPNIHQNIISTSRTFDRIGRIEIRALAIDSAEQVTETTSYLRVLDPDDPAFDDPGSATVPPAGQTPATTADARPFAEIEAPRTAADDPTVFTGTVNGMEGTLRAWFLEWAPLANVDTANLASPAVLWQEISSGNSPVDGGPLATITATDYPDELIVFRLRAENTNGLGVLHSVVLNPRTTSRTGPDATVGGGTGTPALASFTSPTSVTDDPLLIRGTVDANGGTFLSWKLDYAPRGSVNLDNLSDPSVAWTILEQGTNTFTGELITTIDPESFPDETQVFRLTAVNQNNRGTIATLIYNPVASGFGGPTGTTGNPAVNGARPVTRITSPVSPTDPRDALTGSVLANGGVLDRWSVDYAPLATVNANDLLDPAVTWTPLASGSDEVENDTLADLGIPDFQNGIWIIRLRAYNENGLGSLASTRLDTGDTSLPSVAIESPADNADLTYLTPVTGSVNGGNGVLQSWTLDYAPADQASLNTLNSTSANWIPIASGTSAIDGGQLGTIDPTLMRNGSYILRLRAFNTNGRGFLDGMVFSVCGEAKLGNFRLEFDDLTIPLAGIPIAIRRVYDTLDANRSNDFGFGWSLALCDADVRETVPDTGDNFFDATPFEIGTRVFLTTPEGKRVGFTFNVRNPRNRFLYVDYDPYFEPDPGVYETLTIAPVDYERVEVAEDGAVYTPLLPFGFNPDRYRLTTRDGLVYEYDQRSGLKKITDRNGQSVTFSRTAVTHSGGTILAIQRDTHGRITNISAPGGYSIGYQYNANGDLVTVNSAGEETRYTYLSRPNHYLDTITSPADARIGRFSQKVVYESDGRFRGLEDADGNLTVIQSLDPNTFSGTLTDGEGNVTTLVYDVRGNVVSRTDPEGGETKYEYGDPANPDKETAVIDAMGRRFEYTYDRRGNGLSELRPSGVRVENEYTADNQLAAVRFFDPDGNLVSSESLTYDANGNVIANTRADGLSQNFDYDPRGRVTAFEDYDGERIQLEYDGTGPVPTRVTYPDGGTSEFVVDALQRVTSVTDATGRRTYREFDSSGRISRSGVTGGSEVQYAYDRNGNVIRKEDSQGRVVLYSYNSRNELLTQTFTSVGSEGDPGNPTVVYERDKEGRTLSFTDPGGNRTSFDYDGNGNVITRTDPSGFETNFVYDSLGKQIAIIDRRGLKRSFEYNMEGMLVAERWHDVSDAVVREITMRYDDDFALTSIQDPDSRYEMTSDEAGRMLSISNAGTPGVPAVELSYEYLPGSELPSRVSDGSGAFVASEYDGRRNLIGLTWSQGSSVIGSVDLTRDLAGLVTGVERRSGPASSAVVSTTTRSFNQAGLLASLRHLDGSDSLINANADIAYDYNSEGQITRVTRGAEVRDYDYDSLGQLTGVDSTVSGTTTQVERYSYDVGGNRVDSHLGGVQSIGEDNRLLSNEAFLYDYDTEGNLITKTDRSSGLITRYEWDHRNRNTRVTRENPGGAILLDTAFVYDVYNRIITRREGASAIHTVWDGEQPWADFANDGSLVRRYLSGSSVDSILAHWEPGNGVTWLLREPGGNVGFELDGSGTILAEHAYDSFGNRLAGTPGQFGFASRPLQDDSVYNFRSRLYDPFAGRFLSIDRIGFEGGDWNLYRFANNSPLGANDPFGTENLAGTLTVTSLIGTLARGLFQAGVLYLKFAAGAAAAGAAGTALVELYDIFLLGSLGCTNTRALKIEKLLQDAAEGAASNVRTSTSGGVIGLISAPAAAIWAFYTGPIFSALSRTGTRTLECLRSIEQSINNFFDRVYEGMDTRGRGSQPSF